MANTEADRQGRRLAAIDIGSNSVRLVVIEVDADGGYRVLDDEPEMTRLAEGLNPSGRLADEAMERSLAAIGRMKAIAEGLDVRETRAIATAAVRQASNGRTFIRRAKRRLGLDVQVIPGREEARLAYLSASRHFQLEDRVTAVVDIGGGSVEVVIVVGPVIHRMYTLPLGAVRLTEAHVRSDPLKGQDWKALRKTIDREIERRIGKRPTKADVMIGSGGTFTNLAAMAKASREGRTGSVQGYSLPPAEVVHLLHMLREVPLEARRQIPGLTPQRADIIVAGAAVVSRLARHLGVHEILVNEGGVREGLLLDMLGGPGKARAARQTPADRLERVRQFARKAGATEPHPEHVAVLATQMFDALQQEYNLPDEGREILQAAALLHDIGYLINHAKHHKHSYHLIMHGDLPGYSAREAELIANVARYHRRAYPKKKHANFAHFDRVDRRLIRRLSGILRVADGLDRTHTQAISHVACDIAEDRVCMTVTADAHPQVELWDAERKSGLFEKAFKTKLELHWGEPGSQPAPEDHEPSQPAAVPQAQ